MEKCIVTIKVISEEQVTTQSWKQIREPYTNEDSTVDKEKDPQYGYVKAEEIKETEETVYQQTINKENIEKVIRAANGIS